MYRTVVTGASSGIGRETALLLAAERHSLVLVARREALLTDVAKLCEANGGPAVTVVAGDVASPGLTEQAADAAARLPEGELVLVN
ncbi:MAG: SDR family NAD(P)-dependent oxidoreductase, partial [Armatimonadetes bacterium]|nr:SDR family NAD(P)-dependent oxidoreductase [Armatimonadota bacterium]